MITTTRASVGLSATFALGLGSLGGCYGVNGPLGHEGVIADEPVSVTGYALRPNRTVTVQFAPNRTAAARHTLTTRSASTAAGSLRGHDLYAFSTSARVPTAAWRSETDADGCTHSVTYVKAGERHFGRFDPAYFPGEALMTAAQSSCLESRLVTGADFEAVVRACVGMLAPLRVQSINRRAGNVTIASQADVDALRCVEEIDGSLTVGAELGAPLPVALPHLRRVRGDVQLAYTMRLGVPGGPAAMRCGATLSERHLVSRTIDLPELSVIEGDLSIDTWEVDDVPTSGGEYVEIGLNQLTTVGGDIALHTRTPTQPCGFEAMTAHAGAIRLELTADSYVTERFFARLQSVGEIDFVSGNSTSSWFNAVRSAGRVRTAASSLTSSFGALEEIAGDLEVVGSTLPRRTRSPSFATLRRIRGTLRVSNLTFDGESPLEIGADPLLANGLVVEHNARHCLGLGDDVACEPLVPDVTLQLAPAGQLRIADNTLLPNTEICSFVQLMRARGFMGSVDTGAVVCP